ncbi:SseB family protein [Micromonospora sagamiensis]|uniref:SseB family protein n=1 Tax=Micromonospora sagamiensis TaxID=47875 RepID=UPI0011A90472|nr:SseB family protein [Micromonospora sagamiensis]BCL15249.1 hypothetical protein GCM10017556_29880 [Micromonospora sagamiensis]
MTDWEPATEAEAAMRDALRANDQELYFRILARTDLLLPISAEALAGQAPMGWGTWTTNGRTHVLAFTSDAALRACLGSTGGSSRRCAYHDLAAGWPNHEWWLAVNPGLPIEGYLPAWFVSQLSRGDVRLPGRTLGARARLEQMEQLARSRATGGEPPAPEPPRAPPAPEPPRASSPAPPYGANRPPVATPPRRGLTDQSGEATEALRMGQPDPRGAAEPPSSNGAAEPTSSWLTNPRRQLRPEPAPPDPGATPPSNGQPAGRSSFFDPAPSGRGTGPAPISPLRAQDRAVPPSRLGEPGRAFPRRRPYRPDQAGDEPTRAFRFTESAPAEQPAPPPNRFPAETPAAEQTQALPRRQPRPDPAVGEPTQALPRRVPPQPAAEPTQPLPRRVPPGGSEMLGQEPTQPTQPIPQPSGPVHPADPPPVEPVTHAEVGQPAASTAYVDVGQPTASTAYADVGTAEPAGYAGPEPARSPSPLVIEGTVVESRDLVDPVPAYAADPDAGAGYPSGTGYKPDPTTGPAYEPAAYEPATAAHEPAVPGHEPGAPAHETGAALPPESAYEPVEPELRTVATEPADGTGAGALGSPPPVSPALDFRPANDVEEELLAAAGTGSTDTFLSTLLLARVLLPVAPDAAPGARPGESGFVWRTEQLDGEPYVVVYTSPERLADHVDTPVETVLVKFVQLIRRWPDEQWSFAVNPGTPVGAKLPGEQIVALANWAAEVGLGDDVEPEPVTTPPAEEPASPARYATTPEDPNRPPMMQKAIAPSQLAYYLDRGYDRVSGFVHRAGEVAHLNTPAKLHAALGLGYPDSPFSPDAEEIYVLRWPAYRPSLYRIPYGGQNESAMRAMEGWVIERPPFRGNGFAPGESSDVVAEFKVDSARLPHGAQLWRIGADGSERVVATLDTDALLWRQAGER